MWSDRQVKLYRELALRHQALKEEHGGLKQVAQSLKRDVVQREKELALKDQTIQELQAQLREEQEALAKHVRLTTSLQRADDANLGARKRRGKEAESCCVCVCVCVCVCKVAAGAHAANGFEQHSQALCFADRWWYWHTCAHVTLLLSSGEMVSLWRSCRHSWRGAKSTSHTPCW